MKSLLHLASILIITAGSSRALTPSSSATNQTSLNAIFTPQTLSSEETFFTAIRTHLQTHPNNQHDLLSALLYQICLATTPQSRIRDYSTSSCRPFSREDKIEFDGDEHKRIRDELGTIALGSAVAVGFCDVVFPMGWEGEKTDLTGIVERICRVGRENYEKREDAKAGLGDLGKGKKPGDLGGTKEPDLKSMEHNDASESKDHHDLKMASGGVSRLQPPFVVLCCVLCVVLYC
jgi:hypothetical protein